MMSPGRTPARKAGSHQGGDDDGAAGLAFDFDADAGEVGAHGGAGVAPHFRVEINGVAGVAQGIGHALNGGMGKDGGLQDVAIHIIAVDDVPSLAMSWKSPPARRAFQS